MRRLARIALALQCTGVAVLGATQVSASAQPSASPSPSPSASSTQAPSPAASASPASSPTPEPGEATPSPAASSSASPPAPSPSESPTEPSGKGALAITTTSSELVAQVGDKVHYRATVANEGTAPLERVFVVGFLPPEVRFVSADLLPDVEATLYNRIGTEESITWNVGDIPVGDELTLTWTTTVASSGDMNARNAVRAVAEGAPRIRRESSTYLATTSNLGGANPTPTPSTTTVVTYEEVASDSVLGAPQQDGGVVPETGFDGALVVSVGILFVALGALTWWAASPTPRRRWRVCIALAMLALLAACTSSGGDVEQAGPDPTGSPQVKGRRIGPGGQVRDLGGDPEEESDDAAEEPDDESLEPPEPPDDAPATDPSPDPAAPTSDAGTTLVRRTDVVVIDPVLAPPIRLASTDGDNEVGYGWTGSSLSSVTSSSSRTGSPVRIETSVRETGSVLEAVVTITNTSSTTPVIVDGRLHHVIGGAGASLVSPPLDVTLMPGGATSTSFAYDLPSGAYSAAVRFDPS